MKFKLRDDKGRKAGRHIEKDPKTGKDVVYEAGDTIDSERELDVIFPGKFEKIATREDFAQTEPNIIDKRFKSPEAEKEALQKRLAELDAEEDDNNDDEEDNDDDTPDDEDEDEEVESSKYGKDITNEFPDAAKIDGGAKVYIKDAWCVVIDPEADNKDDAMMTKKKIRKGAVEAFLAEYIDDDSDSDDDDDDNDEE